MNWNFKNFGTQQNADVFLFQILHKYFGQPFWHQKNAKYFSNFGHFGHILALNKTSNISSFQNLFGIPPNSKIFFSNFRHFIQKLWHSSKFQITMALNKMPNNVFFSNFGHFGHKHWHSKVNKCQIILALNIMPNVFLFSKFSKYFFFLFQGHFTYFKKVYLYIYIYISGEFDYFFIGGRGIIAKIL